MKKYIKVVGGAIFNEDGFLLAAQRKKIDPNHSLLWEFPGGKVKDGESPEDALIREIDEELGINITVGKVIDVTFFSHPHIDIELSIYEATTTNDKASYLQAHEKIEWIDVKDLSNVNFMKSNLSAAKKIQKIKLK